MLATKENIKRWLDATGIKNYTINSDLTVDVNGDADISVSKMVLGPQSKRIPFQFGRVTGDFNCDGNGFTTLKGCPSFVGGSFSCNMNRLVALKYGPKFVGKDYFCIYNRLVTLAGSPSVIKGIFSCGGNNLISLHGGPKSVALDFECDRNELSSLKGCPKFVGRNFDCLHNKLIDLKYCPEIIPGSFKCSNNKLVNLNYCPNSIMGDFDCSYNDGLISLTGHPKKVGGNFLIVGNKITDVSKCDYEGLMMLKGKYDDNPSSYTRGFNKLLLRALSKFKIRKLSKALLTSDERCVESDVDLM